MVVEINCRGHVQKIDTGIAHICIDETWEKLRLPETYLPERGRYEGAIYDILGEIHSDPQSESTEVMSESTTIYSRGEWHPWQITGGQALLFADFENKYDAALISDDIPDEYPDWLELQDSACYISLQVDYDEHRTLENTAASPKELEQRAGVLDRTTPGVRRLPADTEPPDMTGPSPRRPDMTGPSPRTDLDFHSDLNSVWATDPDTGEAIWRQDIGGNAGVVAQFTADTAYAAGKRTLHAFDADTGDLQWTVDVDAQIWNFTVGDEAVYFGLPNGLVYAVDRMTGDIQWTVDTEAIEAAPAVTDTAVIVATTNGHIYRFDPATGDQQWHVKITPGISYRSSPVVSAGTIYVCPAELVYALSLETGTVIWRYQCDDKIHSDPVASDGTVSVRTLVLEATGSTQLPLSGVLTTLNADDSLAEITLTENGYEHTGESLRMPASALPYYAVFEQAHLEVFISVDTDSDAVRGDPQRESPSITDFSASVTTRDGAFVTLDLELVEADGEGELRLHADRLPDELQHEGASGSVSVYVEFDEDATPIEAIPELYRGDN